MIVKLLHVMSVLMLSFAAALCVFCVRQWLRNAPQEQSAPELSAAERLVGTRNAGKQDDPRATTPLVREATVFALYLNPPSPPAPSEIRQPPATVAPPVSRPVSAAPWFSLLATSYNRLHPERSWALVCEPGQGGRWTRKGDQLGHFVIEDVERGAILCRDGNELHRMTVPVSATVQLGQLRSPMPAPVGGTESGVTAVNASELGVPGAGAPDVLPTADTGG